MDWNRVSELIRERLSDLEAEILVFAPQDSREAGERVSDSGDSEILAQLGGRDLTVLGQDDDLFPMIVRRRGIDRLYLVGDSGLMRSRLVGLFPSRQPGDREKNAAVATLEALLDSGINLGFVHSSHLTADLLEVCSARKVGAVIWLAEGIGSLLARRQLASIAGNPGVLFVSATRPSQRWTPAMAKDACSFVWALSNARLVTDPHPTWLRSSGDLDDTNDLFYLKYDDDRLGWFPGAQSIGRNASTGAPCVGAIRDRVLAHGAPKPTSRRR